MIMIILFFICKWGQDIINKAMAEEENAKNVLKQLKLTMNVIKANTDLQEITKYKQDLA